MEETIVALELGSKKLKLVIGYELNGKVNVIYTLSKPYGHIIEKGNFLDYPVLLETLKGLKNYSDPSAKISFSLTNCVFALPTNDLDIRRTKQITTIVSQEGKIGPIDIRNLYSLIKNSFKNVDKTLVDIIPEKFVLDNETTYPISPLGENSTTLELFAKVHFLPDQTFKNYTTVLESLGVPLKRTAVATLGAVELLKTEKDVPDAYILVDIGSNETDVSLVGKQGLCGCKSFAWGGDNITEEIISTFNISETDAEKYKITYGLDKRVMNFRTPICETTNPQGLNRKYYTNDLNQIITSNLDNFVTLLKNAIAAISADQNANLSNVPIILTGGGSQLHGMVDYIKPLIGNNNIRVFAPSVLGARNPTYTNCLGLILIASKYMSTNDDKNIRVIGMERESE